ncbi:STM3941 family protein [Pedobacter cryotolerans]|uniref:Uncharacterized protein n=1 Tax=Pedobacter cryotolerans TaxID=2571270 RepID=A0A4U1BZW9_9SPHI|nr:STM3941 family protein [Pedobacter cryotolerans]TKB98421.1 hypothetical protein FA045_13965 [Pedobacter cryotolerans]
MERIEIYSSKKKSLLLLIGSLFFVLGGVYILMNVEIFTGYRSRNPFFIKTIGIISILFFGLGIYISVRQLLSNQLILVIDKKGLILYPKKSLTTFIEWKNIIGFSELKIQSQKFVVIVVDNSAYWIDKEENNIRKKMMKFNIKNFGSPFNLSSSSMQLNHTQLMSILNEYFNKYKILDK